MDRESSDNSHLAFLVSLLSSAMFWLCVAAVVYGIASNGKTLAATASIAAAVFGGLRGMLKLSEDC